MAITIWKQDPDPTRSNRGTTVHVITVQHPDLNHGKPIAILERDVGVSQGLAEMLAISYLTRELPSIDWLPEFIDGHLSVTITAEDRPNP